MLETYALLDNSSDVSLCDAELVKELDLQCERRDFLLTTQETKDSAKSGLELKLTISSLDGTSALEIQRVWTVDRLNSAFREPKMSKGGLISVTLSFQRFKIKTLECLSGLMSLKPFG